MPAYRFEALNADGKATTGLLEADNAKAARQQLRARALVPLAVTPVGSGGGSDGSAARFTRRVFSATSRAVWTRQLAGLVSSGLPLERALTALADESERRPKGQLKRGAVAVKLGARRCDRAITGSRRGARGCDGVRRGGGRCGVAVSQAGASRRVGSK